MLYSSSEFRNKERVIRVCVPRAAVRLWQKQEALCPKAAMEVIQIEFPAVWNDIYFNVESAKDCRLSLILVSLLQIMWRLKENYFLMFSPYSLCTNTLCQKEISLSHVLFGGDSSCLILNMYIWAACLDHLTVNGEKRRFIKRKPPDQFWTLTLAWVVLHLKVFFIELCVKFRLDGSHP